MMHICNTFAAAIVLPRTTVCAIRREKRGLDHRRTSTRFTTTNVLFVLEITVHLNRSRYAGSLEPMRKGLSVG